MKTERGLFLTLEGPEGAGKTTQAAMLTEWLLSFGLPVLLTREPGDGPIGAQIRKIILDPANIELTAKAEAMLYAADRAQHVEKVIRPALADGVIVVCDRYVDSNLAYQGYGRGLDLQFLAEINAMATGGLMPDFTLLLTLPPEVGLARVSARLEGNETVDRMEQEALAFHQRLQAGYAAIAAANPQRVQMIDANREVGPVGDDIREVVSPLLISRGLVQKTRLDTEIYD